MKWNDEFSVKVTKIDNQHKKLVDYLNQLHDAMMKGQSKDTIGPILDSLKDYTIEHFKTEEDYFKQFNYQEAPIHIIEHNKFVEKVGKFKADFDAGNATLSIELMNFLKDWLVNHIKGSDQRYVECFTNNGLN
jgi:hemerythrin-like metal-binding protein